MSIPAPTEKHISQQCMDWLSLWGAFPIRVNSGAFAGIHSNGKKRFFRFNDQPGCSDCLCVMPDGRFAAIEFKRPGGKPRPDQVSFLDAIRKRGGVAIVADSLDSLREQLRGEGYQT